MKRLSFQKTRKVLEKYGIPYADSVLASSKKEVLRAGNKLGWPLVLKTASPGVVHRTEKGGVVAGIEDKKALKRAWEKVSKLGKEVIVQTEVEGVQAVLGMKRDSQFGPVLMFGLGGVMVEVLEDVSFRVAPVSGEEAEKMAREIKGFKVLKGFRGRKGVNLEKLKEVILSLSSLSLEEEVREVDFNPLFLNEKEAVVVDARLIYD